MNTETLHKKHCPLIPAVTAKSGGFSMKEVLCWLANNKATMGVDGITVAANMPKETIKMEIVVISTLPIIFAYPFFQRYFVNGLTVGAVKE